MTAGSGTETSLSMVREVSLELLTQSPLNVRKSGSDEISDKELLESVREMGVLMPVLARPRPGGGLEVIAGGRRLAAARAAGLATIPVRVMELNDQQAADASFVENLVRQEMAVEQEALALKSYMERHGATVADLAKRTGKSAGYIRKRLAIADAAPAVFQAAIDGKISWAHVFELARGLSHKEQRDVMEILLREQKWRPWSVAELQRHITLEYFLKLNDAPFKMADTRLREDGLNCQDCQRRTRAQSLLFDDITDTDRCLDAKCYQGKIERFVELEVDAAKSSKQPLVRLNGEYSNPDKTALDHYSFSEITPKEAKRYPPEEVGRGIYVNGRNVGRKVWYAQASGSRYGLATIDPLEKEKRLARERKEKHRKKWNAFMAARIVAAAQEMDPAACSGLDQAWRFLAHTGMRRAGSDVMKRLAQVFEMPGNRWEFKPWPWIEKQTEPTLKKLLVANAALELAHGYESSESAEKILQEFATALGVSDEGAPVLKRPAKKALKTRGKQKSATPATKKTTFKKGKGGKEKPRQRSGSKAADNGEVQNAQDL